MMLIRPESMFHSVAMAMNIMGVTFLALTFWEFALFLWGVAFLACGLLMLLQVRRKRRMTAQLLEKGQRAKAKIVRAKHHTTMNLSFSSSRGRAAARSPWTAYCEYQWEGKTYSIHTDYLWGQPWTESPDVEVALDPAAPDKGVVDPQTIRYVTSMR